MLLFCTNVIFFNFFYHYNCLKYSYLAFLAKNRLFFTKNLRYICSMKRAGAGQKQPCEYAQNKYKARLEVFFFPTLPTTISLLLLNPPFVVRYGIG